MASAPVALTQPEQVVSSREEWWALFDDLRLSQQGDYADYGGPVAFFRKERDADSDLA